MATINKRMDQDGRMRFQVIVRLKGHPTQTATFHRVTDAKKWAQQTEAAIREGRYFKTIEAKKHSPWAKALSIFLFGLYIDYAQIL